MEIEIVPYSDKLKQSVFSFTDACFSELGKKFEPEGRHSSYNDIENAFKLFICLTTNNDQVIGTVALKKVDDTIIRLMMEVKWPFGYIKQIEFQKNIHMIMMNGYFV